MKVVACQLLTPLPLLLAALVSPSSQDRAPKKARLADAIEQANGDGEEPRHRISESAVSDSPKIRTDPELVLGQCPSGLSKVAGLRFRIPDFLSTDSRSSSAAVVDKSGLTPPVKRMKRSTPFNTL